MSIKFPPAILGSEMAAPILWAPGILGLFLKENPHAHKIPPFRGGVVGFLEGGGGSADFIFMGVGIFPTKVGKLHFCCVHIWQCFPKMFWPFSVYVSGGPNLWPGQHFASYNQIV